MVVGGKFVDLYKTLSIMPNASIGEIKSAFYQLAKSCHPDVSPRNSDEKFKRINEAYHILTQDRAAYDQEYEKHLPTYQTQQQQQRYTAFSGNTGTAFTYNPIWDINHEGDHHWGREQKDKKDVPQETKIDDEFFWEGSHKTASTNSKARRRQVQKVYDQFDDWMEAAGGMDLFYNDNDNYNHIDSDERGGGFDENRWHEFKISKKFKLPPRTLNSVQRSVVRRIRESPRINDIPLLLKFGLNPADFGLDKTKTSGNSDREWTSREEEKATKKLKESKRKQEEKAAAAADEEINWDEPFPESEEVEFDLKNNMFRRATDIHRKSKKRQNKNANANAECQPEVEVFNLASHRPNTETKETNKSPVLSDAYLGNENRVEEKFFLDREGLANWLVKYGDRQRLYGVFRNGVHHANVAWAQKQHEWATEAKTAYSSKRRR